MSELLPKKDRPRGPKIQTSLRFDSDLRARLQKVADATGYSITEAVERFVRAGVERVEAELRGRK